MGTALESYLVQPRVTRKTFQISKIQLASGLLSMLRSDWLSYY